MRKATSASASASRTTKSSMPTLTNETTCPSCCAALAEAGAPLMAAARCSDGCRVVLAAAAAAQTTRTSKCVNVNPIHDPSLSPHANDAHMLPHQSPPPLLRHHHHRHHVHHPGIPMNRGTRAPAGGLRSPGTPRTPHRHRVRQHVPAPALAPPHVSSLSARAFVRAALHARLPPLRAS